MKVAPHARRTVFFLCASLAAITFGLAHRTASADTSKLLNPKDYASAKDWKLKGSNLTPWGQNPLFFPLKPGHKHILEKSDHPDGVFRKEVQVLDKTEPFELPGVGEFQAAIIQEEEFFDGRYSKQTLKWAALDKANKNVYVLGEISWEIEDDGNRVFDHTWRAGEPDGNGNAEPGLWMPGAFKVGARYIIDVSEGETLTGAQNIEKGVSATTPAGKFDRCVKVREQGLVDTTHAVDKVWCPKVGLVSDSAEGQLIVSDTLPKSDLSVFGKYHREKPPAAKAVEPKISHQKATEIALNAVPGKANAVTVERKRGKNVYVVEVIAQLNGVETDVFVDMETGQVVGIDK